MANKTQMGIGAVIVLLVAAYFGIDTQQDQFKSSASSHTQIEPQNDVGVPSAAPSLNHEYDDTAKIAEAFAQRRSDIQVRAIGKVVAVLRDDNEGSRHQKFILELNNAQTVLVAHNIDLAPRIEFIQKGDWVEFYGEYEYSEQGGVIHWTHHDPARRHVAGWLKHEGRSYQ